MHRVLAGILVALFASLLSVRPLAAQSCTTDDPPCPPNEAPRLTIHAPASSPGQRTVRVTVTVIDDVLVDLSSVSFKQNGASRSLSIEMNPPGLCHY